MPSAPTMRGCLQWLEVVRTKAAKAAGSGSNPIRARKHGSGDLKTLQWSAERRGIGASRLRRLVVSDAHASADGLRTPFCADLIV